MSFGDEERPTTLAAAADRLGPDELEVLTLIADRLAVGRAHYGELHVQTDERDFEREALEECADGLVYAAIALLKLRRARAAKCAER